MNRGDWKIIRRGKPIPSQTSPTANAEISLYDLGKDISESNNVAEQYPDRVDRMLSDLAKFRKLRPKGGVDPQTGPMLRGWKPLKNREPSPETQIIPRR